MAEGLLASAGLVYAAVVVGAFAAVASWETLAPLRTATAPLQSRWTANIGLLVINHVLLHALLPLAAVATALHAQTQGWGLLPAIGLSPLAAGVAGLLLLDLVRWLFHATMHHVPLLWRLHRVHHSDTELDCTVGLRFHPLEAVLSAAVLLSAVALLGVPPLAVLLSDALSLALAFFAHANTRLPPRVERVLHNVLVTPDLHRVHHSCVPAESMSNFGSVFSLWDRLFGTRVIAPAAGATGMRIGLDELRDPAQLTLWRLLALPLRR